MFLLARTRSPVVCFLPDRWKFELTSICCRTDGIFKTKYSSVLIFSAVVNTESFMPDTTFQFDQDHATNLSLLLKKTCLSRTVLFLQSKKVVLGLGMRFSGSDYLKKSGSEHISMFKTDCVCVSSVLFPPIFTLKIHLPVFSFLC